MGLGVLAFSVAMGALFAVVYCVAYGRVGDFSPRLLSVLLAGGMLLSLYVIPALKYPPNPPAVSLDETIRQRTLLYLLMVVLSAALIVAAVWLGRRLAPRFGGLERNADRRRVPTSWRWRSSCWCCRRSMRRRPRP